MRRFFPNADRIGLTTLRPWRSLQLRLYTQAVSEQKRLLPDFYVQFELSKRAGVGMAETVPAYLTGNLRAGFALPTFCLSPSAN